MMESQLTLSKSLINELHRLYDILCGEYLVIEEDFLKSPSIEKRNIVTIKKSTILELDRFIQGL